MYRKKEAPVLDLDRLQLLIERLETGVAQLSQATAKASDAADKVDRSVTRLKTASRSVGRG